MTGSRSYPLNAWYVAAWDTEVGRNFLTRTICDKKVLLYRTTDGRAVALEDACWHRLAPLSLGKLVGNDVGCGYHGLRFNSKGRCTFMPSQETINPSARVHAFPIVEKYRFVWIWPGDPALANPDLVPDVHWNDDPAWAGEGGMVSIESNFQLLVDNLMDLTHETFVHESSIGNEAVAEAPFEVVHGERTVTVIRWMLDNDAPPFWRALLSRPGNVDRWQIIRFEAPSVITMDVGVAIAGTGAPQGDRSQGVTGTLLHILTPSTETSSYYFWNFLRNFRTSEQRITTMTRQGVPKILAEDRRVIEAQQQMMRDNPDKVFYNLNIDAGAMWARRLVDEMLAKEQGPGRVPLAAE
ncbi:MAG: aromatic ring-hydroxylating dioxygenase subunit alpha [Silvibacterium sp.]|nr:aromatic ring-hydroxylating dioxygenase subunit alpha [Silvibacterium sp.]